MKRPVVLFICIINRYTLWTMIPGWSFFFFSFFFFFFLLLPIQLSVDSDQRLGSEGMQEQKQKSDTFQN